MKIAHELKEVNSNGNPVYSFILDNGFTARIWGPGGVKMQCYNYTLHVCGAKGGIVAPRTKNYGKVEALIIKHLTDKEII